MISESLAAALSEWKFSISNLPSTPTIAVLLLAAVAALVWTYKRLDHLPRRRIRWALTFLRAFTLLAALALLTEPALIHTIAKPTTGHFHVLVDVSHSMVHGDGTSRLANARRLVEASFNPNGIFARTHHVHWHRFAGTAERVDSLEQAFEPLATNTATHLEDVVASVVTRSDNGTNRGALLISDGASSMGLTSEQTEAFHAQLEHSGIPINVLAAADDTINKDLSIISAKVDSFAFSRSPTPIEVELGASGIEDREIEVLLWQSGAVLQTQRVNLLGGRGRARFEITPRKLGKHILKVTVPNIPEDRIPQNNEAHVVFDVMQDKLRILHVSGAPSWDQRFLRDVLSEWPRIDLLSFYVLRTEYQSSSQGSAGLSLIPFPTEEVFGDHLSQFDVIVFQNFQPSAVGVDRYLDSIAQFVESGGSLVLVAGPKELTGRSLAGSKLKDLVPTGAPPAARDNGQYVSTDPFIAKLTEQGRTHPVTRVFHDDRENNASWQNSAKLDGIIVAGKLRKDAIVLAEHPFLQGGKGQLPLVTITPAGKGRILSISTDSLWKWRFSGPMQGREADLYTGFWHNAIAWLTRDPSLDRLTVSATPARLTREQSAQIDIQLFDEMYAPKAGETVSCNISFLGAEGVSETVTIESGLDEQGKSRINWSPQFEGPHTVAVQSRDDQSAQTQFLVESTGNELAHMEADPDRLQSISRHSKGVVYQNELDFSSLVLGEKNEPKIIEREELPLWNHPFTLLLLTLLIASEWYLRRKSGLR